MKVKSIFVTLAMVLAVVSLEAQTKRGSWGVELGTQNVGLYEFALSKRWTLTAKAGLALGAEYSLGKQDRGFNFSGVVPIAGLATRWHFSSADPSRSYHQGLYLGLDAVSEFSSLAFLEKKVDPAQVVAKTKQAFALVPSLGWTIPVSRKSYVRCSLGLSYAWTSYRYTKDNSTRWVSPKEQGVTPLHAELVYGLTF